MTWNFRIKSIAVGDRVCYSRTFLQSTGQITGDLPFARGTVTELKPLGEITLAVIDWGDSEIPSKVNVANLSKVDKDRGHFGMTRHSDMADAFLYAHVKIVSSHWHLKHPTRKYKVIYQAHPFVVALCWLLRRWVRMSPWVEAFYADDADAFYIRDSNILFVGEAHLPAYEGDHSPLINACHF